MNYMLENIYNGCPYAEYADTVTVYFHIYRQTSF